MLTTSLLTQVQLHTYVRKTAQHSFLWNLLEHLHHNSLKLRMIQSKFMESDVCTTNVKDNQWLSPTLHVMWNNQSYQCQDCMIDRGYDLYWANTGTILRGPSLQVALKRDGNLFYLPAEPQTLEEGWKIQTITTPEEHVKFQIVQQQRINKVIIAPASTTATGARPIMGGNTDIWIVRGNYIIRVHKRLRRAKFTPENTQCPVPTDQLDEWRQTTVRRPGQEDMIYSDNYPSVEPKIYRELIPGDHWKGETTFRLKVAATSQQLRRTTTSSVRTTSINIYTNSSIQCYTKGKSNNEESTYGWRTTRTSTKKDESYTREEISYTTQSTKDKPYNNRWTRTSTNIYIWTIQNNTCHRHTDRWSITDQRWMDCNRHACRTTIHMERYNHLHTQRWVWIYTWGCCNNTTRTSRHTTGSKESKSQTTTYTTNKARDGRTRTDTHALQKLVSHSRQSKRPARCLQTTAIKAASHLQMGKALQYLQQLTYNHSYAWHLQYQTKQYSMTTWSTATFIHSWMWTYKWHHSVWQWTYTENSSYRGSIQGWKHDS